MREFISKWSNWWITAPTRKWLDEAFEKELNELIEREVALRMRDISARLSSSLGEVEGNAYDVVFDNGRFWINHKVVGSGEPLKQWIDGVLNVR